MAAVEIAMAQVQRISSEKEICICFALSQMYSNLLMHLSVYMIKHTSRVHQH